MKAKHIFYLAVAIMMFPLVACKKIKHQEVTVVRDCTGVYLRMNNKDYHVCNTEAVESFANGTKVNATFRQISQCNGSAKDDIVCMMLHENEGWIEVVKVK